MWCATVSPCAAAVAAAKAGLHRQAAPHATVAATTTSGCISSKLTCQVAHHRVVSHLLLLTVAQPELLLLLLVEHMRCIRDTVTAVSCAGA